MFRKPFLLLLIPALCLCTPSRNNDPSPIAEWQAEWIGAPWEGDDFIPEAEHPTPEFAKTISLDSRPESATMYICGLGMFEAAINGERVGEDYYVPNNTMYGHRQPGYMFNIKVTDEHFKNYRVMYLAYDVTGLLKKGENAIGVTLGNGWYAGWRKGNVSPFGTPRLLCQIEIKMKDGSTRTVCSDTSWQVCKSPILYNNIYSGEAYDARLEACKEWQPAVVRKAPEGALELQQGLADRIMEVLEPKSITRQEDGSYEVDFGDYITGRVHLYGIKAPEGTEIELLHPIDPEDSGNNWVKRSWNGDYKYICKGSGSESYAPSFNWYTFRKVVVKGWPGELKAKNLRAEAIYTDIRTTGRFECSNPLINRVNHLFWRTQTDNMHMGVASDCPHREKGAYTGDGQVACVAVMENFDADKFYRKWLRDMSDCQDTLSGYVPNTAPFHPGCGGGVAWGAAINIIPWEHYRHYADKSVLEEHYDAMQKQLAFMESWRTEEGIMNMQMPRGAEKPQYWLNLGDWCPAYDLPEDRLVHTYFLWKCARFMACSASVLGKTDDAARYDALARDVRAAFHKVFYNPETASYGDNNGSNVFALHMGVPEENKAAVVESLRKEIEANGGHINTGIFGTQIFFDVLCDNGLSELAYSVMTQKECPGYGWWVEQGADTMWEYWDGKKSRNHPMFGGGLTWLYTRVAGLRIDDSEPGYKHMIVRPTPMGDLSWASYETETPQGKASVRWDIRGGKFMLKVIVPEGSHATVYLPGSNEGIEAGPGKHRFTEKI